MRLYEIESNDHPDYEELKRRLLQPGVIEVADATYSRGNIGLGDLVSVKAGHISRRYHSRSGERIEFSFEYFTHMDGQPLKATLKIGKGDNGRKVLQPGQSFTDDY